MPVRHRAVRVVMLTLLLLSLGSAGGFLTGTAAADEPRSPYRCFFVTDPQGHVIQTICIPWPI